MYTETKVDEMTVSVWQMLLPEPYQMVISALQQYMRNNHYAPKPADLVSIMHTNTIEQISSEDAWEIIRKSYMRLQDEHDKATAERIHSQMPESVRRCCTPQDLIDWAFHTTTSAIKSYEKPRFQKAYTDVASQDTQKALGSQSVTQIAIKTNETRRLTDGREKN